MPDGPDASATGSAAEQRDAKYWLDCIVEAEKAFSRYQDVCDKVEKLYASLDAKSEQNADREFQIFWANLEVLKPTMYSRPPVPVVVPRFQNRKELPRKAAEIVERCLITSFEADDVDSTMRLARDDLATNNRGVVWLRYVEDDDGTQRSVKEHLDRRDFLHEPARKWKEVGWVARRVWLTRAKGLKRFGDKFAKVQLKKRDDDPDGVKEKKAPVWEIWSKDYNTVVWVTQGLEETLDQRDPYLKLDGFFPCPRPAYGTLKPRSLIPVPDLIQYKDQIEEINELTARISSLSESLRLKGFYPAGASEVGDAIEAVLRDTDNRAVLVPINNLALFGQGGGGLKDSIVWLPVQEVATVVQELVLLRKQLIDDVYQITGISDIMRGTTEASETLGAQQLKSQYGSIRIRDRQNELIRLARDVTRIEGEIIAENFSPETLVAMSQVDDLPTDQQVAEQIAQLTQQVQLAAVDPIVRQQAQANPEQAQQMLQQAQQQVQQLQQSITIDKVVALLRSQRLRPFMLEIETDSTIQPDEDAAKQRASEFITAVGGFMQQAVATVEAMPQAAPVAASLLQYVAGQFRTGREVYGVIDEFAEQMKQIAQQPKAPPPDQVKAQAEQQRMQSEQQSRQMEVQARQQEIAAEAPVKAAEAKARMDEIAAKSEASQRDAQAQVVLNNQKIRLGELQIELAEVNLNKAKQPEPTKEAA